MTFNLDFDELGITIDKPVIELEYCELTIELVELEFEAYDLFDELEAPFFEWNDHELDIEWNDHELDIDNADFFDCIDNNNPFDELQNIPDLWD
jgi:hypothetical protein